MMASDLAKKYNLKSPAVKRLMREAAELSAPTDQYFAQPLEDNLFEWHFTVRGPPDSDFDDGRYHGRITLPPEYPMKPPSIILITPNGRFEIGKKICLSMSAHHPETWQPSWSIRTVLLAIIGFMPTPGSGAIGALDYTPEERKRLAKKSREWKCETCDCASNTVLLERDPAKEKRETEEAKAMAAQINFKAEEKRKTNQSTSSPTLPQSSPPPQQQELLNSAFSQYNGMQQQQPQPIESNNTVDARNNSQPPLASATTTDNNTGLRQRAAASVNASSDRDNTDSISSSSNQPTVNRQSRTEQLTLVLTWIVTVALVILVLRRLAMDGASMTK